MAGLSFPAAMSMILRPMTPKQRAAEAAIPLVKDGMVVGLGTGSTSECFVQAMAAAIRSGRLRGIRGVGTSRQSERHAAELGIPLTTLRENPRVDITVDGADEVAPNLNLIKGLGGALLREKIVAQASRRLVIIADSSKRVTTLGTRSPLPIEVVPFAHETHVEYFHSLGSEPVLRLAADGKPFVTDNGNYIYDCRFASIPDPQAIENAILHRAGIVDCGLFLNIASLALVADDQSVEKIER
jgi:ribose 5-phosphate isomerase A